MKAELRKGNYRIALKENYNPTPFEILHFIDGRGKDPKHLDVRFEERKDALEYCKALGIINECSIYDCNSDWL